MEKGNIVGDILRCELPEIPEGWDRLKNPELNRFAKTYNYFKSDEVSSAFQKSVRRGESEAIQWALELYWTGPWHRTNIWNRILVVSVEDIGLACPSLITYLMILRKHAMKEESRDWGSTKPSGNITPFQEVVTQGNAPFQGFAKEQVHGEGQGNYIALARAVQMCVSSRKSRMNDWAAHVYNFGKGIPVEYNLEVYDASSRFKDALKTRDPFKSLLYAEILWRTDKEITMGRQKKAGYLLWSTLGEIAKEGSPMSGIYKDVEELGMSPNWRWQGKTRLLWIHLINMHCYISNEAVSGEATVSDQGVEGGKMMIGGPQSRIENIPLMPIGKCNEYHEGDLVTECLKVFHRKVLGIPDYALDLHTGKGKSMGRGLEHFIEVGSFLNNRAEELISLDDQYLKLCNLTH